ncbi:Rpn family recombination-promoting nuclease/putative transposase [Anthocerotibacter panamensis]|uniref:Rpn family recombination-promoting nuclease/putative transposase n=1 Tax=Anthocerotibacter panamensis TaxID=2857077 RepID=UPI001C403D8C|nr:Rpn family recombination-promoting nuclease/putative transposase [Anthocerotibacter panamensis]
MKTDSLFYELFQKFPDTLFALTGQPTDLAANYRFTSEEVKQTTFTLDGIFIPQPADQPIYFVEVQFQKDPDLCSRMFTELMLFLRHHTPRREWQAVIIVPTRSLAPRIEPAYDIFAPRLQVICLKELLESEHVGVELVRLVAATRKQAPVQAKRLLKRAQREVGSAAQEAIEDFIGTIMVYKFPLLSRQELEAMLDLGSIKKSRVYQEGREEGREEGESIGEIRGERHALLRMLNRKFGPLPQKVTSWLNSVESKAGLEQLMDRVIDAQSLEEFEME